MPKPFVKGDPRAGRKKGSKNRRTIEVEEAQRVLQQAIFNNISPLVSAAIQSARGEQFMFRVDRDEDGKEKHVQLEDPNEIREGLNAIASGEFDDAYYYISTKPSNPAAFKELMDRGFGKAPQQIKAEVKGELTLSKLLEQALMRGDNKK